MMISKTTSPTEDKGKNYKFIHVLFSICHISPFVLIESNKPFVIQLRLWKPIFPFWPSSITIKFATHMLKKLVYLICMIMNHGSYMFTNPYHKLKDKIG